MSAQTGKTPIRAAIILVAASITLLLTACPMPTTVQPVTQPQITPLQGTYSTDLNITITTATAGASLYYTTDGSTPTSSSTPYTAPFAVSGNGATVTVKAIATKAGMSDSGVATTTYTINYYQRASQPVFSPQPSTYSTDQSVTITSATAGAVIHYTTDGTNPNAASPAFSAPILVSGNLTTKTIKAYTAKSGQADSEVVSATYSLIYAQVANPAFAPTSGTYSTDENVILTSTTPGATIYYTIAFGGAIPPDPTTASTMYSSPIAITGNGAVAKIKAIAGKSMMAPSGVASADYTINYNQVSTPQFSPASGVYAGAQNVQLTCSTPGASIRYTTDGTTPTSAAGNVYSGPFAVPSAMTVKAAAFKPGMADSTVASAGYGITPLAPTGFTVGSPTSTSLTVSWTAVTDIPGTTTTYQVFRDVSATGPFYPPSAYDGPAASFTDANLQPNSTYYYKVQASNSSGSSPQTSVVSGLTSPDTPAGLTVGSPTASSLAVSWSSSAGANTYQVFRDTSATGPFNPPAAYDGPVTSFTDSSLQSNTAYYYKVRATSTAAGSSPLSAAVQFMTAPVAPAGLAAANPTVTTLDVSWTAVAGISSYQVFRDTSATGAFTQQVYSGSTTSFTDTSLLGGTVYYYVVQASNAFAHSALSAQASGMTKPATPSGLTVGSPTTSSLAVSWTASTGADTYQLFRSTSATGPFTPPAVYDGPATSFTDTTLSSNTSYYYEVQATSTVSGSSPLSSAVQYMTAPVVPTGLTAGSPTESTLLVSWTAVTGTATYQVYRDTSATGAFTLQVYTGSAASFTDTGLAGATTYYYKVRASNTFVSSVLSAAASGMTKIAPPTGLSVGSQTTSSLTVSWSASNRADTYQLFRSTNATGPFTPPAVYDGPATSFTDTLLQSNTSYYYAVQASSVVSGASALSAAVQSMTAPDVPAGLTAGSPTESTLLVSWTAVTGTATYQVYRDTSATGAFTLQVYTGSATSFTDSSLAGATTYYYKVMASNTFVSSVLSAAASGMTKIAPPTGLSVGSQTATTLGVSWNASNRADTYQLFRSTNATGPFTPPAVYDGPATSFTDTLLQSNTSYYYAVQASSVISGASVLSAAVQSMTAPNAPAGLTAGSPTSTSLAVSWTGISGVTGYQVFRDTSSTGPFTLQVYTGSSTTFTDLGLSGGTTYYYKVSASNAYATSVLSAAASGLTMPSTPAGLAVGGQTHTTLAVSWSASTGADTYQVFRDTSATGTFAAQAYTGAATGFTDSGLTANTSYYYKVQATNASGASALSAAVQSMTAPDAPAGLAVGNPTSTTLSISWSSIAGTSYQVFRDTSSTGPFTQQVYTGTSTGFTDLGLASGTTFYYKVQASNAYATSVLSAAVSGLTRPATPTGLLASAASSNSISLSWNVSTGAASYQVFRDSSSTGTFTTQAYSGSALSFTDTGLNPWTTYWYKIWATNASGSSALSSPPAVGTTTGASWANTANPAAGPSSFSSLAADASGNAYAAGFLTGSATFGSGVSAAGAYSGQNAVLVGYNSSGTALWAATTTAGSASSPSVFNSAAYGGGATYAAGSITGTAPFNFATGVSATGASAGLNAVLVSYSAGTALWAASPTGSAASSFNAVAADGSGNAYAAGSITGNQAFTFATGVTATGGYAGGANAVLVKYNSAGTAQWAAAASGPSTSVFNAVAVDGSDVYAAGVIIGGQGAYSFGGSVTATATYAGLNVILVKYTNGTAQWARTVASAPGGSQFNGITVDTSHNVYVAGIIFTTGTFSFGGSASATGSYSGANAVLVQYNSSGIAQWAAAVSGTNATSYNSVAYSSAKSSVLVTGTIQGTSQYSFPGGAVATGTSSGSNIVVVKYATSGTAQAATSVSSGSAYSAFNAAAVAGTNLLAGGTITGTAAHGFGGAITATGGDAGSNVLLVQYPQ